MNADTIPAVNVAVSSIEGNGIFASRSFESGERIIEYAGAVRRWSDYASSRVTLVCLMGIGGDSVIDPRIDGNETRYINHSCDPNCEAVLVGKRVYIYALRTIAPGEELTMDYCLMPPREVTAEQRRQFTCRCGAPNCRGTMLWNERR